MQRQKRRTEIHSVLLERIHIVANYFRIPSHHRTVQVIVGGVKFFFLVEDAGIENKFVSRFHELFDMTMHQLGRIARGFRCDGCQALFVQFSGRHAGEFHPKAQFRKESVPEGVVFKYIQDARQCNGPLAGRLFGQALIREQPVPFVLIQIGQIAVFRLYAGAAFAAVSGDIALPVGEGVDCESALIGAAAAIGRFLRVGERFDRVFSQKRRTARRTLSGDQRHSQCPHQPGYFRPDGAASGDLFKSAQDRIAVEGAPLHDDILAEFFRVAHFNHFLNGVFND